MEGGGGADGRRDASDNGNGLIVLEHSLIK